MSTIGFDKKDLRCAYDEYFEALRNFLYYKSGDIALAEDLVQEVFIKIWEKRSEIRKDSLKSLLFTIGNNLLLNHFNHAKIVRTHENEAKIGERKEHKTPQFQLEEKEFEDRLNSILEEMPPASREVFLMNRIDKVKYDEIALRLGISVKAVEKRMSKALAILRETLGRKI